jgi:hypothetical protein
LLLPGSYATAARAALLAAHLQLAFARACPNLFSFDGF